MCGGTWPDRRQYRKVEGLSPRVRGNLQGCVLRDAHGGSIPACAGEPQIVYHGAAHDRVYPRVCGGTGWIRVNDEGCAGLSPRVRGNPVSMLLRFISSGSIPACAGEPKTSRPIPTMNGVYPRVCGGTFARLTLQDIEEGLSPRVRGNPGHGREHEPLAGSIPACAGEPLRSGARGGDGRVYPRVCGGTRQSLAGTTVVRGLSPRVRGNREPRRGDRRGRGSIPACAGEPSIRRWAVRWPRVYPRVCGGTSSL